MVCQYDLMIIRKQLTVFGQPVCFYILHTRVWVVVFHYRRVWRVLE